MTGSKHSTGADWVDPDDAPDLSAPEYQAKLAATPVRRGRPKSEAPKVRIGFRLSAELVERVKASGPGYNGRVEKVLREEFMRQSHSGKISGGTYEVIGPVGPRSTSGKAVKRAPTGGKRRA